MKFIKETGALIDSHGHILAFYDGTPGMVEFSSEILWELHQKSPGIIYGFAHTHPPGMKELSHEDMTTLQSWCQTLYPFPFRFIVFTLTETDFEEQRDYFSCCTYQGFFTPTAPKGKRFRCIKIQEHNKIEDFMFHDWEEVLAQESYK